MIHFYDEEEWPVDRNVQFWFQVIKGHFLIHILSQVQHCILKDTDIIPSEAKTCCAVGDCFDTSIRRGTPLMGYLSNHPW